MPRIWWKRRKTFAMLSNRKQYWRYLDSLDPSTSTPTEITTEAGAYLVLESSTSPDHSYITTE